MRESEIWHDLHAALRRILLSCLCLGRYTGEEKEDFAGRKMTG